MPPSKFSLLLLLMLRHLSALHSAAVGSEIRRLDGPALVEVVGSTDASFVLVVPRLGSCGEGPTCRELLKLWEIASSSLSPSNFYVLACDEAEGVLCSTLPLSGTAEAAAAAAHLPDANTRISVLEWGGALRGFVCYGGKRTINDLTTWIRRRAEELPTELRRAELEHTEIRQRHASQRKVIYGKAPSNDPPSSSTWAHAGLRSVLHSRTKDPHFAASIWSREPQMLRVPGIDFTEEDLRVAVERDFVLMSTGSEDDAVVLMDGVDVPPERPLDTMAALRTELQAGRTVLLSDGGARIPKVAALCGATIEAFRLKASANIYIAGPGSQSALSLHTDSSMVLVVQLLGAKRWRVFRRSASATAAVVHPVMRGKNGDRLDLDEVGKPVLDTVLTPGQALLLPSGTPHLPGMINITTEQGDISMHATIGLGSALFFQDFAALRLALMAKLGAPAEHLDDNIALGSDSPSGEDFWQLLAPLPHVGFLREYFLSPAGGTSELAKHGIQLVKNLEELQRGWRGGRHYSTRKTPLDETDVSAMLERIRRLSDLQANAEHERHRLVHAEAAHTSLKRVLPHLNCELGMANRCAEFALQDRCKLGSGTSPATISFCCGTACNPKFRSAAMNSVAAATASTEQWRREVVGDTGLDERCLLVTAVASVHATIGNSELAVETLQSAVRSQKPPFRRCWLIRAWIARLLRHRNPHEALRMARQGLRLLVPISDDEKLTGDENVWVRELRTITARDNTVQSDTYRERGFASASPECSQADDFEETLAIDQWAPPPPPDELELPRGCQTPSVTSDSDHPDRFLIVNPYEPGCAVAGGRLKSCGQFNNVLSTTLQALALSRVLCRTLVLPGFYVRSRMKDFHERLHERWLPTSHFYNVSRLRRAFHVMDHSEWLKQQRRIGTTTVSVPLALVRPDSKHWAREAELVMNLSFTALDSTTPWRHARQHGSEVVEGGAAFWRHEFTKSEASREQDVLVFNSPVAFGFNVDGMRWDNALRWTRGHMVYTDKVRAEVARLKREIFQDEPYLAVQIRRGVDRLMGFCMSNGLQHHDPDRKVRRMYGWAISMASCFPSVEAIADAIVAARQHWGATHVFIASDSTQPELFEDVLIARGVHFSRYGSQGSKPLLPTEYALSVDMLMCAEGKWFLGNVPSTVTGTIQQDRDNLGLPRSRSRFFGFGPNEHVEFDHPQWARTDDFATGAGALF